MLIINDHKIDILAVYVMFTKKAFLVSMWEIMIFKL